MQMPIDRKKKKITTGIQGYFVLKKQEIYRKKGMVTSNDYMQIPKSLYSGSLSYDCMW